MEQEYRWGRTQSGNVSSVSAKGCAKEAASYQFSGKKAGNHSNHAEIKCHYPFVSNVNGFPHPVEK